MMSRIALAGFLLGAAPALAQQPPASSEPDNFQLAPAEGRHLKMDRRSGTVSLCEETGGRWSCRLVADDRQAFEDEIARLRSENEVLRKRVDALESAAAEGLGDGWIAPEDEQKLDEFLDFTDKAFRRFFGMVQDLKQDLETPDRI